MLLILVNRDRCSASLRMHTALALARAIVSLDKMLALFLKLRQCTPFTEVRDAPTCPKAYRTQAVTWFEPCSLLLVMTFRCASSPRSILLEHRLEPISPHGTRLGLHCSP